MSFATKYSEYGLPNENFLAWYEFNDSSDSGPNGNDLTIIVQQSFDLFTDGIGKFNNDYLETPFSCSEYSVFIDFERVDESEGVIFSQRTVSSSIFFGFTKSGLFFLKVLSNGQNFTKFFNSIHAARRCILILKRDGNKFLLSHYCPINKAMYEEALSIEDAFPLPTTEIKFGLHPFYSDPSGFAGSKFNLRTASIINVGVPSFVIDSLCEEMYLDSPDEQMFKFDFLTVNDRGAEYYIEPIENTGQEINVQLHYSSSLGGFTKPNFVINDSARFFRNGLQEYPTVNSNFVSFAGQSEDDLVIFDNLNSSSTVFDSLDLLQECVNNSIDLRIKNKTLAATEKMFSSVSHANQGQYFLNSSFFGASIDLSPLSVYSTPYGSADPVVAISPIHVISYILPTTIQIGNVVRFVRKNGSPVERTIVNYVEVAFTFKVGILDSDLPDDVSFAKILPDDFATQLPLISSGSCPCFVLDYLFKGSIKDIQSIGATTNLKSPTQADRLAFTKLFSVADTYKPVFLVINNNLTLLSFLTSSVNSTTPSGSSVHYFKSDIATAISTLGGGYLLTETVLNKILFKNSAIFTTSKNGAILYKNNRRVSPQYLQNHQYSSLFDKDILFEKRYTTTEIGLEVPEGEVLVYDENNILYAGEPITI